MHQTLGIKRDQRRTQMAFQEALRQDVAAPAYTDVFTAVLKSRLGSQLIESIVTRRARGCK